MQIIAQTANFVRGAGRQSIFVLRVKQGGNPKFAFLMPDNPLHPYFQWLVEENLAERPISVRGLSGDLSGDIAVKIDVTLKKPRPSQEYIHKRCL